MNLSRNLGSVVEAGGGGRGGGGRGELGVMERAERVGWGAPQ